MLLIVPFLIHSLSFIARLGCLSPVPYDLFIACLNQDDLFIVYYSHRSAYKLPVDMISYLQNKSPIYNCHSRYKVINISKKYICLYFQNLLKHYKLGAANVAIVL